MNRGIAFVIDSGPRTPQFSGRGAQSFQLGDRSVILVILVFLVLRAVSGKISKKRESALAADKEEKSNYLTVCDTGPVAPQRGHV